MNMASQTSSLLKLYALLFIAVLLNIMIWFQVRPIKVEWKDVPPVPSITSALWSALGDKQLAYRGYGIMIQNMGDTGGAITNVADYDKEKLAEWFMLMHQLDPDASHIPRLAGFFFAAQRRNAKEIGPILDYLEVAAGHGEGQKWRFLAHAVFLARYRMEDMDRALGLAQKLASFKNPDMPVWARQMNVFILTAQGEKEAAYNMMINLLRSSAADLHPTEVNETIRYICTEILTLPQAERDPLCEKIKDIK